MIRWIRDVLLMRRGVAVMKYPRPRLRDYLHPRRTVFFALGHAIQMQARWEEIVEALHHNDRKRLCICIDRPPYQGPSQVLIRCSRCRGARPLPTPPPQGPYR